MRIAVVHSFYSAHQPSGENVVVADQAATLRQAGYEVELVARHTDEVSRSPGYRFRAGLTTATGRGPSPAARLRAFRPDVVHLHNTFPNWGTRWLREWGSRTVTTIHNYRSVCSNGLLFRDGHVCFDCLHTPILPAVRHGCYRDDRLASVPLAIGSSRVGGLRKPPTLSARLIALNSDAQSLLSEVFQREVDLVPNFVHALRFEPNPNRGWIYVGRLSHEKGIRHLLHTWPTKVPLDIVGSGPLLDDVQHHARARENIRVIGSRDRHEVLEILPSYAGLVLPSLCAETLPTVVIEALAAGVPTLLSHHVQAGNHLRALGVAETYSPEEGVNELIRALKTVDARSAAMRQKARAVHATSFSVRAWQTAIDRIYDEVARVAG